MLETTEPYTTGEPYIHTFSGGKMYFGRPDASMIRIVDIAHALARSCRWTGHVSEFYSIAQHSVLVAGQVPKEYMLRALLHDASEAYTGDINKPLKSMLGDAFKAIEERLEIAIFTKYGLGPIGAEEAKRLKNADLAVALAESEQLLNQKMYHVGVTPAKIKIEYWSSVKAEETFLEKFKELM